VYAAADDGFWLAAAGGVSLMTLGWIGALVRRLLHARQFSASHFVLAATPAYLGERLRGTVLTGVPFQAGPAEPFRLQLECVHAWEERSTAPGRDRQTHHHRDVLWRTSAQVAGVSSPELGRLAVAVDLDLPADRPAATAGFDGEG